MSDNLEVAKECGAIVEGCNVLFSGRSFDEYTSRILASQQAAAQIERRHVEWMMKLPIAAVVGMSAPTHIMGAYSGQVIPCTLIPSKPEVIMLGNLDVGSQLVAIPPLPKESDSPETDLDEALRRQ